MFFALAGRLSLAAFSFPHPHIPGRRITSAVGSPLGRAQPSTPSTMRLSRTTAVLPRTYETVVLAEFTDIEKTADLTEGGLVVSPNENNRRAEAYRKMLGVAPKAGTDTIIITHKPNIVDALSKDCLEVKEGEASIFRPENGSYHRWRRQSRRRGRGRCSRSWCARAVVSHNAPRNRGKFPGEWGSQGFENMIQAGDDNWHP
ncbi:MAG: hypothetical protein WAL40_09625 [Rhodoplanes sp.]